MPKSVDIYVLSSKIGQGQFGDVFRGFSKVDGTEVAIKVMRRDKIKGKFTELLQSEIQVLKSCKNNNIVRLIDIKKTVNNIYLVLEYCNEGDMLAYLKAKKKIPYQEAVQYFVQILHAFQTLVKNKIMHRDFKLANVLKHDGIIKIADFGFAKLLGSQDQMVETILGSPLNMAPEILDRQNYNSKADIWSIGVAFYELLFGKVPYTANNIIDLIKKIKNDPLPFPSRVHPHIEDVLRKMLVIDPVQRIEWVDLFAHPVTRLLEDDLQENLRHSMLGKKDDISINLSKFYIKTNKVVENVNEIRTKKELNGYVKEAIANKGTFKYQGAFIRRHLQRQQILNEKQLDSIPTKTEKQLQIEDNENEKKLQLNYEINKMDRIKNNCRCIFHYRNIYAFYGHLAQDLIESHLNHYYQCLAFLLLKKTMTSISILLQNISKHQIKEITLWEEFELAKEYHEIKEFITAEEDIFNRFYEQLSFKVFEEGTLETFQEDLMISGKFTLQETNNRIYQRVLRAYLSILLKESKKINRQAAKQILKLIDSLRVEQKFAQIDFHFIEYYETFEEMDELLLKSNALAKAEQLLGSGM